MDIVQILVLLLALSTALNIAFGAGLVARAGGLSVPASVLTASGAAATALTVFFAAVSAYR